MHTFQLDNLSDWFWNIIDAASKDETKLRVILNRLTKEELSRFLYESHLAAGVLQELPFTKYLTYESEDGMNDISWWVVTQGKEFFVHIWHHPETIPQDMPLDDPSFFGIAEEVYETRFNERPDPFAPT